MYEGGLMAGWQMVGQVLERRELTSAKSPTWRGYVVKVATIGNTFEVTVTPDMFGGVIEQTMYQLGGRFEEQSGRLKLICERIKSLTPATTARSKVSEVG